MKLKNLIPKIVTENSTQSYDYGCVMIYFNFDDMEKLHKLIDPADIYTEDDDKSFGLEDEPHTTLLYGFHKEVSVKDIESVTDKYTYYTCRLHNPSLFESKDYDVIKFDVDGENFKETNSDLKQFPHTSTFPNYHPHLTVGYVKKGMGKKYVEEFKKRKLTKFWVHPQFVMYSHADGSKTQLSIKTD